MENREFSEVLNDEMKKLDNNKNKNTFKVNIETEFLNVRKNPRIDSERVGFAKPGICEITNIVKGKGSNKGWGMLSDSSGYINLDYVVYL